MASTIVLPGRLKTGGAESQLMTFPVTLNRTERESVPPPASAPLAITVTVPLTAPAVAVSSVIVVVRFALTAPFPAVPQLAGSVTEAGVVAESLGVLELTLKLTTALFANTLPLPSRII
ncbi:MAG: hypothetical protein ACR2GO_07725 [Candidatus Limnocylindria bacterium]